MAFTAQNFDGQAAAQRMLGFGHWPYHQCLGAVAEAIKGDVSSDNPGAYEEAMDGWNATPQKRRHPYDGNMPAGAVFYAATSNISDGHVAISLGGNRIVSTDSPRDGVVSATTVDDLVRRWGIRPLGWTDWFLGHNVTNLGGISTAGDGDTPAFEEEYDMTRPTAVVNDTEPGVALFAWIAVVTGNGELHLVEPGENGDRGWWEDLTNCYTPKLEATHVTDRQYLTFVGANQTVAGNTSSTVDGAAKLLAAVDALDKQADNYQTELRALIKAPRSIAAL